MKHAVVIYARGHKAPEAEGLDTLVMMRTGQRTIVQYIVDAGSWHEAIDTVVELTDGQGIRGLVTASTLRAVIGAEIDAPLPELAQGVKPRRRSRHDVDIRETRAMETDETAQDWDKTVANAMRDIERDMNC